MKPNHKAENDEPLGDLLEHWTVDAPLPPRFQEQVWQKIARAEKTRPALNLREMLARWLESVLPRPKFAVAYLAALLVLGVAGGTLTAQIRTNHLENRLGTRYIQSLSPYQAEGFRE